VRDLGLPERLETLAREASERLRELVRSGEEIPFALIGPGEGSAFAQYAPETGRFVREHTAAVASLDAFGGACAAIREASLAAPYLEATGEPVPEDEELRCKLATVVFLARLWEGSSDFSLHGERLPAALRELEGSVETPDDMAEVVAPLLGFHMPTTRLELATATLARADMIEVPDEVRRTEGSRRSAWEPQFLAVVRAPLPAGDEGEPARDAMPPGAALRESVTTLRLFKAGGVGLGPYAWARTPGDRWRRCATGAAQPRPGGYRLTESELGDLAALSRALADGPAFAGPSSDRSPAGGAVARAISRFEAGLERAALLEALSDYVLALRCLLEGGGGAELGLGMRMAALCATREERSGVKAQVERALALEQKLMHGELPDAGASARPLELVAEFEDRTRSLLRDTARGRLGADLRASADEVLLSDGLRTGEGAAQLRGATAEWGAIDPPPAPEAAAPTSKPAPSIQEQAAEMEEFGSEQPTTVLMAVENGTSKRPERPTEAKRPERPTEATPPDDQPTDWLSEVDSAGDTLDWPERPEALKLLDRRPAERQAARKRVRHLFPRPEQTEWGVAELRYDRSRRARV
jgi:hypothetical protein